MTTATIPIARPIRVLYVDDDTSLRRALGRSLRRHFDVDAVGDAASVEAAVKATRYDAFITDLEMPDVDGWEMIRRVAMIDARLARRAVILTGARFTKTELVGLATQGHLVIEKGASSQDIANAVYLRIQQHP